MLKDNRYLQILLIALTLVLFAVPAAAQDDDVTDDEVNEVARDVYCPVCENTPLDVCQTKACADWRELIRTKLGEGQTEEEIFNYFALQYGDGVLANPPRRGASLVILWVLPIVLILLGLLFFGRIMRSLRGAEPQAAASSGADQELEPAAKAPQPARDDYLARVEEELDKNNE